jgi:hypothetical protein
MAYSAYDSRSVFTKDNDLIMSNGQTLPSTTSLASTNVVDLGATTQRFEESGVFVMFDISASLTIPTTSSYIYLQDCATATGTFSTLRTIELSTGTYTRAIFQRLSFGIGYARRYIRLLYSTGHDVGAITATAWVKAGLAK